MELHDFLVKHSEDWSNKYPGKYLAIVDKKIAGMGSNGHEAFKQAKAKYPDKEVHITYMPTDDEDEYLI